MPLRGALAAMALRGAVPLALVAGLLTGSGLPFPGGISASPSILPPLTEVLKPGSARDGTPQARPVAPSNPLAGRTFAGTPAVGSLVHGSGLEDHSCTASVVHSPARNLVVTAAHCVSDDLADLGFVPGYLDGTAPYGVWAAERVVVDPRWSEAGDPDYDVAFLTLESHQSANVEDVTGANELGIGVAPGVLATAIGYPAALEEPIACLNYTRLQSERQLRFDCARYTSGTSGGPLLTEIDPGTGRGTIVGVVGGYQEGGDTADVSYSPYFGAEIGGLYRSALASA